MIDERLVCYSIIELFVVVLLPRLNYSAIALLALSFPLFRR